MAVSSQCLAGISQWRNNEYYGYAAFTAPRHQASAPWHLLAAFKTRILWREEMALPYGTNWPPPHKLVFNMKKCHRRALLANVALSETRDVIAHGIVTLSMVECRHHWFEGQAQCYAHGHQYRLALWHLLPLSPAMFGFTIIALLLVVTRRGFGHRHARRGYVV